MRKRAIGWFLLLVLISLPFRLWADQESAPVSKSGVNNGSAPEEAFTLDQCLKLGYQNSRQLEVAAQNVAIAEEGLRQAYGGYLPTLNYSVSDTNPPSSDGNPWNGSLSLNVYLYNGGKITTGVKLARLKLDSALEERRKAKQQAVYNIKTAFYNLWLAQQMLIVAQSSYNNMGTHYEHVSKANRMGMATKFDLLKARIQWEKLKPPIMKAEHDVDLAKLNLANCVGLNRTRPMKAELDIAQLQILKRNALSLPVLLEEAYKNRPETHQADQQVQIADCNVKLAEAGYKPTVTLSPKYSGSGSDFQPWNWDQTLNLSANLSGVLFDGLTTARKVAAAQDSLKISQINQTGLRDQIGVEVETAFQDFEEAIDITNFNQAHIDFAKESVRVTQSHYDAGMATTLDIADAQLNLDTTLNGYYQGVSSYLTALAKLDLARGKDVDEIVYNTK
jgi:outer membrane protein TolC